MTYPLDSTTPAPYVSLMRGNPDYLAIDWDATADNLRADYSEVEIDGATYWYR